MTGQGFRANCPLCGRRVALRADGTLAVHPRKGERCAGSGIKPPASGPKAQHRIEPEGTR